MRRMKGKADDNAKNLRIEGEKRILRISCKTLSKISNAESVADVSREIDDRMSLADCLFFTSTLLNKRRVKGRKRWRNMCYKREGGFLAVCGENREEDEDVSMPRPNKIEIFVDENRMSSRWKKGC